MLVCKNQKLLKKSSKVCELISTITKLFNAFNEIVQKHIPKGTAKKTKYSKL